MEKIKETKTKYKLIDAIGKIIEVNEIISSMRKALPMELESKDTRQVSLRAIQTKLMAIVVLLNSFNYLGNNNTEENFKKILGIEAHPLGEATRFIDDLLRGYILTFFLFKIECLFVNLLLHINKEKYGGIRKFAVICDSILKETNLNQDKNQEIFVVLAAIRNSHHNNGVHKNTPVPEVDFNGKIYEFKKDEPVMGIYLFDLLDLMKIALKVVEKIFTSNSVKALPAPIIDSFLSQVETLKSEDYPDSIY